MAWQAVIEIVLPVFIMMGVGYVFGAFRKVNVALVTDFVVYIAAPCLIVSSLTGEDLDLATMGIMALGATWLVVSVGGLLRLVGALTGKRFGTMYLPAMFLNAGNMLLPLALFAFGEAGLRYTISVFVTVTILQGSLGVSIAAGRPSVMEALRFPHIYAAVLALLMNTTGFRTPAVLQRPIDLLGDTAVPLMLIALGIRLRDVRISSWRTPSIVTAARIGGGYMMGLAFVSVVDLPIEARGCLLLASVMPAAVVTFVFAEKYGRDSGEVAASVALSTAVSVLTTPMLLAYGL